MQIGLITSVLFGVARAASSEPFSGSDGNTHLDQHSTGFARGNQFTLFSPTVCGVSLLGNVSSHWTVVIDSTKEGIMFPSFLYDSFITWVGGSDGTLFFSPSEVNAPIVPIDLSNVSVTSTGVGFGNETNFSFPERFPIIFGSDIMFRSSNTSSTPSNVCSVFRPECVGGETYYEPLNVCLPPECGEFFFQQLDDSTRTCVWSSSVYVVSITCVLALLFGEALAYGLRRKVLHVSRLACERGLREE
jgi:hypothetical protein